MLLGLWLLFLLLCVNMFDIVIMLVLSVSIVIGF